MMSEIFEDCVHSIEKYKEHNPLEWKNYELEYGLEYYVHVEHNYKKLNIIVTNYKYSAPLYEAPAAFPYCPISIRLDFEDHNISIRLDFGEFSLTYSNTKDHEVTFELTQTRGFLSSRYVLKPAIIRKILKDLFSLDWLNNTGNNRIVKIQ